MRCRAKQRGVSLQHRGALPHFTQCSFMQSSKLQSAKAPFPLSTLHNSTLCEVLALVGLAAQLPRPTSASRPPRALQPRRKLWCAIFFFTVRALRALVGVICPAHPSSGWRFAPLPRLGLGIPVRPQGAPLYPSPCHPAAWRVRHHCARCAGADHCARCAGADTAWFGAQPLPFSGRLCRTAFGQ